MSKKIVAILVLLTVTALFAFAEESEYFVKTVPITKVYLYKEGYRVLFLKGDLSFGEIYLPVEWFNEAGGKGELVLGTDPSYPYVSIFWKGGTFDHIRLYLVKDMRDPTWGEARITEEVKARFKVDNPEFEF